LGLVLKTRMHRVCRSEAVSSLNVRQFMVLFTPTNRPSETSGAIQTYHKHAEELTLDKVTISQRLLDILTTSGQVVVFSAHKAPLEMLAKRHDTLLVTGDTKESDRDERIRLFRDGQVEVLAMTTALGSLGLNLQNAFAVIIIESAWNPVTDEQAAARVIRIGQTRAVLVFRLVAKQSLDMYVTKVAMYKKLNAEQLVDEKIASPLFLRKDLVFQNWRKMLLDNLATPFVPDEEDELLKRIVKTFEKEDIIVSQQNIGFTHAAETEYVEEQALNKFNRLNLGGEEQIFFHRGRHAEKTQVKTTGLTYKVDGRTFVVPPSAPYVALQRCGDRYYIFIYSRPYVKDEEVHVQLTTLGKDEKVELKTIWKVSEGVGFISLVANLHEPDIYFVQLKNVWNKRTSELSERSFYFTIKDAK
jgi:superfamily II DNA/RNA helicase